MEKRKIILPTKQYEGSPEDDLSVRLNLEKTDNLLREGDRNIELDLSKLFDDERNSCKNYKIFGKIKMVFRNLYSGYSSYDPLKRNLYLNGDGSDGDFNGYIPYNEFAFLRNDIFREQSTPLSGTNPGEYVPNISLTTGFTDHNIITASEAPYKNWNVYLSYVYSGDTNYNIKYTLSGNTTYSFTSGDGIPFRVIDDGKSYKLVSPVEHGIKESEYIVLSGGTLNNSINITGRTFSVNSVGDETYNSEKFVINLLKSQFPSGTTLSSVVLGRRCLNIDMIDDTVSTYYVHKHKTLTNEDGYILDKAGFESPIFKDEKKILFINSSDVEDYLVERNRMESVIFDFKEPFVLSGLTNNLNYTPTEVYVTNIFRNGNGYFDYPPKVGYKFNFHDAWIDNQFSGNTSNETSLSGTSWVTSGITFTSGNTVTTGTILTGAFVEYNKYELKERIISEAFHKFTSPVQIFDHSQTGSTVYSGASVNNKFGLYYQPHYRVKLRELSPYIETSRTTEIYGLPENLIYDHSAQMWKWRDLYDHGYVDPDGYGTNYPFLNNCHYVKTDINFYLRNEVTFTNKQDGIAKFKKLNC